jgi:hypothetical protein
VIGVVVCPEHRPCGSNNAMVRYATFEKGEKGWFCRRWRRRWSPPPSMVWLSQGRWEGLETVALLPVGVVGSVGSRRSRVWCASAVARWLQWRRAEISPFEVFRRLLCSSPTLRESLWRWCSRCAHV